MRHYTLTLTGDAQRLSDAFGDGVGVVNDANNRACRLITFQAHTGNTGTIKIGGGNQTVTTDSWAVFIPIPTTSVPAAPITLGPFDSGPLKLSELYALGSVANDKLQIGMVEY